MKNKRKRKSRRTPPDTEVGMGLPVLWYEWIPWVIMAGVGFVMMILALYRCIWE